jgi:ribonuclease-3
MLTPPSTDSIRSLESRIGRCFRIKAHLVEALTHRSASRLNNERLEFLGDSVLGLVIADWLFEREPDANEGQLAQARANLVNTDRLHRAANKLGLGTYIILGRSEECSGGREKKSILANAVEAIIAAIYLDGGIQHARNFIIAHLIK